MGLWYRGLWRRRGEGGEEEEEEEEALLVGIERDGADEMLVCIDV